MNMKQSYGRFYVYHSLSGEENSCAKEPEFGHTARADDAIKINLRNLPETLIDHLQMIVSTYYIKQNILLN